MSSAKRRLVIVLHPILTVPLWSSKASAMILSRNMLKRMAESRHPCRTPTVLRNHPSISTYSHALTGALCKQRWWHGSEQKAMQTSIITPHRKFLPNTHHPFSKMYYEAAREVNMFLLLNKVSWGVATFLGHVYSIKKNVFKLQGLRPDGCLSGLVCLDSLAHNNVF